MTANRFYTVTAVLGAALCLLLFAFRLASAVSFSEPLQLHTTGDEFTNYFNIWKSIQGEAIYSNRFEVPFSAAVYNWLFYTSYGVFSNAVLTALSLSDAWLPTVARMFSILAALVGAFAAYFSFVRAANIDEKYHRMIAAAFAVFLMFGPLLGFWTMTVRADVWAMAFEIIAIALFLRHYPNRRFQAVLWLCVFVYLAWSFKQGNVFAAGGAGLLLLVRLDWKPLLALVTVLPGAWALTFYVGEPSWASSILFSDFPLFFYVERMIRNLVNVGIKTGPVLFVLIPLLIVAFKSRERFIPLFRNDTFILATGASFCGLVLSVPLSAQHGGAENYFFTLFYFFALMMAAMWPLLRTIGETVEKTVLVLGGLGWLSLSAAIGAVFIGNAGIIDLAPQHRHYTKLKACTDSLPRPLYMHNPYMGLPWMTPGNTPWVVNYIYNEERALNRPFQHGGIGGLIASGAFTAIAIPGNGKAPTQLDNGSLNKYRTVKNGACPDIHVFLRSE